MHTAECPLCPPLELSEENTPGVDWTGNELPKFMFHFMQRTYEYGDNWIVIS